MAVYTKINKEELEIFLSNYKLGELKAFTGIVEGIENTIYLITTEKGKYILTLYEKRVKKDDLPFFMNLLSSLSAQGFKCPSPIKDKQKKYINKIKDKNASLVSYIEGKSKKKLTPFECKDIGKMCAKIHLLAKKVRGNQNQLSINYWKNIFNKTKSECDLIKKGLANDISINLNFLEKNWPKNLPSGIIHADIFPDNVLFNAGKVSGIIDFYFSCIDFFAYDVAICLNSLCFENQSTFNVTKAKNFIKGYNSIRELNKKEKEYLPILAQGAAMRFLVTRIYDYLKQTDLDGAIFRTKDPMEYLKRLEFHNSVKNYEDYF
tara:strand:+ start:1607 stop:2566 length:960 start_codon:yes stop_codon:yes gene_type:complete